MTFVRSVLAWLHRSWAFRLLEPLAFPSLMLLNCVEHMEGGVPGWLFLIVAVVVLIWVILAFVVHHWARAQRPRRDRSRPILEQITDEGRDDIPLEEAVGLKPIPQMPPPPLIGAFIRAVGRSLPGAVDTAVTLILVASATALIANGFFFRGMTLNEVLATLGLAGTDLSRWDVALLAYALFATTSLRTWAVGRRAEFDGEAEPRHREAYG